MADEPAILRQPAIRVGRRVGAEDAVDHHRQDRHVAGTDGISQSEVDRGVLQRRQHPVQHSLCERTDKFTAPRRDLRRPFHITHPRRAVALIKRIEPVAKPMPEDDRPPTNRLRNRRMLTLRIPRHIHATTKRDRPRVEALGE